MILYFVRHGQTIWNKKGIFQGIKDSPLTELGREQAEKLKEKLNSIEFTHFYSSPLGRAKETLAILTKDRINPQVDTIPNFREINLGDMEGVPKEYFQKIHPNQFYNFWNDGKHYDPTDFHGETFQNVYERAQKGLQELIKKHNSKDTLLIVSHGILLEAIFTFIKKEGIEYFGEKNVPKNTSFTIVEYCKNEFKILDFSNISHLK
ncbi:MAG: histidine phosphatase family protein [Fusobacterium sp. JB021]|nr:histidine phosphatase family protein [Fusobacterium sp. JB020]MDP0493755.1 histidine phosphatase family protein [Fusobacterium sp. JB021]MDP0507239.1 histidine phosphatase family protein [Fusobacterium sp. JB019]